MRFCICLHYGIYKQLKQQHQLLFISIEKSFTYHQSIYFIFSLYIIIIAFLNQLTQLNLQYNYHPMHRRDIQKFIGIYEIKSPRRIFIAVLEVVIVILAILGIAVFPIIQQEDYAITYSYYTVAIALLSVAIVFKLILMRIQLTTWKEYFKLLLFTQCQYFICYLFVVVYIVIAVNLVKTNNKLSNDNNSLLAYLGLQPTPYFVRLAISNNGIAAFAVQSILISLFCCQKTITKLSVYCLALSMGAAVIYYSVIQFVEVISNSASISASIDDLKQLLTDAGFDPLPPQLDDMSIDFDMIKDFFIAVLAILLGYYLLAIDMIFRSLQARQLEQKEHQLEEKLNQNTHEIESELRQTHKKTVKQEQIM